VFTLQTARGRAADATTPVVADAFMLIEAAIVRSLGKVMSVEVATGVKAVSYLLLRAALRRAFRCASSVTNNLPEKIQGVCCCQLAFYFFAGGRSGRRGGSPGESPSAQFLPISPPDSRLHDSSKNVHSGDTGLTQPWAHHPFHAATACCSYAPGQQQQQQLLLHALASCGRFTGCCQTRPLTPT
jgi:hypothetical protein